MQKCLLAALIIAIYAASFPAKALNDAAPSCKDALPALAKKRFVRPEDADYFLHYPPTIEAVSIPEVAKADGVDPTDLIALAKSDDVNKRLLQEYVNAREFYAGDKINSDDYHNYNLVRVLSVASAFYQYQSVIDRHNAQSAMARLGQSGSRKATIQSIAPVKDERPFSDGPVMRTYRVQFKVEELSQGKVSTFEQSVVIGFKYGHLGGGVSEMDRCLNPLGFRVVNYDPDR